MQPSKNSAGQIKPLACALWIAIAIAGVLAVVSIVVGIVAANAVSSCEQQTIHAAHSELMDNEAVVVQKQIEMARLSGNVET